MMSSLYRVTLIIPTYGRIEELKGLLTSLTMQEFNMEMAEIIVVDQNQEIDLSLLLEQFSRALNIVHIKSDVKGIAAAKNRGLKIARGEIVTFPDDDCLYYPDTLAAAMRRMYDNPEMEVIYGRLYDRNTGKNITREWSNKPIRLDMLNFHLNYAAFSCFTRNKSMLFDERLGIGSNFGIGEELDYVIRLMERGSNVYFMPDIEIWHAKQGVDAMTIQKTYYYAKGYGATFRKHPLPIFLFLFFLSCCYQLALSGLELLCGNFEMSKKRWLAFTGRVNGFKEFGDVS